MRYWMLKYSEGFLDMYVKFVCQSRIRDDIDKLLATHRPLRLLVSLESALEGHRFEVSYPQVFCTRDSVLWSLSREYFSQ